MAVNRGSPRTVPAGQAGRIFWKYHRNIEYSRIGTSLYSMGKGIEGGDSVRERWKAKFAPT